MVCSALNYMTENRGKKIQLNQIVTFFHQPRVNITPACKQKKEGGGGRYQRHEITWNTLVRIHNYVGIFFFCKGYYYYSLNDLSFLNWHSAIYDMSLITSNHVFQMKNKMTWDLCRIDIRPNLTVKQWNIPYSRGGSRGGGGGWWFGAKYIFSCDGNFLVFLL